MNDSTNRQEGKIFRLPSNRMEAIIMLCGLFSFVSTWAGAYKVTNFFSGMAFLGIPEEAIHFGFSLFTALLVFYIIYSVLLSNIERSGAEYANLQPSTTFILAGVIVIALSFWLSVEGLTLGYKTFVLSDVLAPYNNDINYFNAEVDREVRQPIARLIETLKQKRNTLFDKNAELHAIKDKIAITQQNIELKLREIEMYSKSNFYLKKFLKAQREYNQMQRGLTRLINSRRQHEAAESLMGINQVTEKLSSYRFGKSSTDTLMVYFTRGESLSESLTTGLHRDKLEELHELQGKLNDIQSGYNSFLDVLKAGLQENKGGSRGFVIIILFFALLGDMVPLLISLKNNNPNTLQGFFKEAVQWFHEITDEIAKVDFVRRISRACVGFLFSIEDKDMLDSFKQKYLNPLTRAALLDPLVFSFNCLLAITIVWALIGFVLPEEYHHQIAGIFHNWTTRFLDLVERVSI